MCSMQFPMLLRDDGSTPVWKPSYQMLLLELDLLASIQSRGGRAKPRATMRLRSDLRLTPLEQKLQKLMELYRRGARTNGMSKVTRGGRDTVTEEQSRNYKPIIIFRHSADEEYRGYDNSLPHERQIKRRSIWDLDGSGASASIIAIFESEEVVQTIGANNLSRMAAELNRIIKQEKRDKRQKKNRRKHKPNPNKEREERQRIKNFEYVTIQPDQRNEKRKRRGDHRRMGTFAQLSGNNGSWTNTDDVQFRGWVYKSVGWKVKNPKPTFVVPPPGLKLTELKPKVKSTLNGNNGEATNTDGVDRGQIEWLSSYMAPTVRGFDGPNPVYLIEGDMYPTRLLMLHERSPFAARSMVGFPIVGVTNEGQLVDYADLTSLMNSSFNTVSLTCGPLGATVRIVVDRNQPYMYYASVTREIMQQLLPEPETVLVEGQVAFLNGNNGEWTNSDDVKRQVKKSKRQTPKRANRRAQAQPRRRQVARRRTPTSTGLSACAMKYAEAIANPFSQRAIGACIPTFPSPDSSKQTSMLRSVSVVIGTSGVGGCWFAPSTAYNVATAACTTASYSGTSLSLPSVEVAGDYTMVYPSDMSHGYTNFSPTVPDMNSLKSRAVSYGVRVKYTGTQLNMGGTIGGFFEPSHNVLTGFDYTMATVTSRPIASYESVDRRMNFQLQTNAVNAHEVAFQQVVYPYTNTYVAPSYSAFRANAIGVIVIQGEPGNTFNVEIVTHYEYTGNLVGPMSSPTHTDARGFEIVQQAAGQLARSTANNRQNNWSVMQGLLREAAVQVMPHAINAVSRYNPIAGMAARAAARGLGFH